MLRQLPIGDITSAPPPPFLLNHKQYASLPGADQKLLGRMLAEIRTFKTRRDIIQIGEMPDHVHLMVEGWSCRYSVVDDGRRQITALLIPGDFCDANIGIGEEIDHSIGALGEAKVAFISKDLMAEAGERPALKRALRLASRVDESILRAWIINIGRRSAYERVAHLICELQARLQKFGVGSGDRFELPLSQEDLSDALGLTPVHINRVLRRLREQNLMTLSSKAVTIYDLPELRRQSGFDDRYLRLS